MRNGNDLRLESTEASVATRVDFDFDPVVRVSAARLPVADAIGLSSWTPNSDL